MPAKKIIIKKMESKATNLSAPVYSFAGEKLKDIALQGNIFGLPIKGKVVHEVVVAMMNNKRATISHTKDRAEVSGGGKKPWKQKGTGRARQGSIRSPQWKGGGVVFGPRKERNWSVKINKKLAKQAFLMSLSDKAKNEAVIILADMATTLKKTKDFVLALKKWPFVKRRTLIITAKAEADLIKAGRNYKPAMVIPAQTVSILDVLKADTLVIEEKALPFLAKRAKKEL